MNIIRQSSASFILVLAVVLSSMFYGCGGGSASGPLFADNTGNSSGGSFSPSDLIPSNPPPPAPVIITAEATTNSVFLKWTDKSSREFGFIIVRDGVKVGETDRNISQWTDLSVLPDTAYVYEVVAWNKEGEGVSPERVVTTLALPAPIPPPINRAPIISSVSASSASIEMSKQSFVSCQASDPDNDPLTYSWSANYGVITGSGSSVQWTAPLSAGTYAIQCSVSDGKGGSDAKATNVTVTDPAPIPPPINRAPIISSVSASPASVETGKQSTVLCSASDPDNDPLTYSWSANAGTFTGSGSSVQWTAPASSGTYAIQCSVSDGKGGSRSGVTDILVTNPIPVQTKWQVSPGLIIRSLATDQTTGEVYAAGRTATAPTDVFLAKFNPDGTLAWEKRWGTAECDNMRRITVFNHEIFLEWLGNDTYCIGGNIARISRFDSTGNEINTFLTTNSILGMNEVDNAIIYYSGGIKTDYQGAILSWGPLFPLWINIMVEDAVVRDGIAYYVGQSQLLADPTRMAEGYTAAVDNVTGDVIWAPRWGAQTQVYIHKIAVNVSGVYTFRSDFLVLHYDFSGNLLWTYQGSGSGWFSYTVTDDTAVYAMGDIYNGGGLTKINNDGTLAWQTSVVGRSLALFNNVLFVADGSNVIRRYDALTGALQ